MRGGGGQLGRGRQGGGVCRELVLEKHLLVLLLLLLLLLLEEEELLLVLLRRRVHVRGERGGGGGGGRGGVRERDAHPGVLEDLLELDAVPGADAQAAADKVLALVGEAGAELDLGHADLLVLLEGDVPADHVVQEDPQRPDGGGVAVVAGAADPLRGSVDASACKGREEKNRVKNVSPWC